MKMTPNPDQTCQLCRERYTVGQLDRCVRCWELERRIKRNPELARQILATIATALPV